MMGQSERKVAVSCRIGECKMGESRMVEAGFGECRLGQCKTSEMSPTSEGRISPAGEFFVVRASRSETPPLEATREAGSTLPQATPKQPATLVGKT
jgi:hypothetical protein